MAIIESSLSDHKQIYLEVNRIQPERPKKLHYEAVNYIKLYETIRQEMTSANLMNEYKRLEDLLQKSISKDKVMKTKLQNAPKADWINKDMIKSINIRNILWHKLKQNPKDEENRNKFIQQRNFTRRYMQTTKNQYYHNAFQKCERNPLNMWQLINSLVANKPRSSSVPSKLNTPLGQITETKDISEHFNKFFSNIGSQLASQIPKEYHDNPINILSEQRKFTDKLLHFEPATVDEIDKIIDSLDTNTSTATSFPAGARLPLLTTPKAPSPMTSCRWSRSDLTSHCSSHSISSESTLTPRGLPSGS
ncbi:putative tick transposon [Operophtera brumata]|uniref:Putative tick transposon n=1 Tax=Operophtera brumata TaxID=104452 RepID=A0A0L7LIR6_OPEBR|nr:putative tick transposon [Operophtera brumata]